MGFSQSRDGSGVTVVKVEGQLIVGNRQELKDLVFAALDNGERRILIDFSQTGYIDSSSLGVLIGAHRRLKLRGGALVVVCDNEAIVKTFRITGLDGVFTLVRSLDDALDGDAVSAGG